MDGWIGGWRRMAKKRQVIRTLPNNRTAE